MKKAIRRGDTDIVLNILESGYCVHGCLEEIVYTIREGSYKNFIVSEILKYSKKLYLSCK